MRIVAEVFYLFCPIFCALQVVMSTKNVLGRPWVEFVLGIDQVIKGFDRALPLMSVGERSMITVTPEYGCKNPLVHSIAIPVRSVIWSSRPFVYQFTE
jgi:hypothetical protein